MKKRLICMLLTVLMVVSAFTGAGLSATAETVSYSTMTYRMAAGDYVLRICQRLGLNYYVCKDAIMKLNNITEGQWRYLPVGKLLILPATDADAVVILTGRGSTAKPVTATTPVATVSAGTSTATTTQTSAAAATTASTANTKKTTPFGNDVCWWYLVPYRLASGETVVDACNALGISFYQYQDLIKRVNKIKNWNNISAGTEIWIPTVSMPKQGTSCIIVMRHMMKSGETAYGVMNERGLDYNAAKPLLQIINEKHPDLAKIQAGEAFFYPVAYTIPLQAEIHGKLDTGTESNPKYKLNSGFETGVATVEFYVGNNRVYTAAAGETVKVVINATAGRAVKDVIIRHSNGQADLYLKSAAFVMPKCDITVDATFTKGHKIEIVSNYLEKALTLVDGVAVNSAAKGAAVLVASADPSLAVDELYVSYMTYDGLKREKITNIDDGFVMPDVDVKVEVVLKPLPTYALFVEDAQNGTFTLQVDGGDVTRAARGAQVMIVPKAATGYTVGNIQFFDPVTGAADNTIGVFNNTFTMPARDVGVRVTFIGRGNNILMNPVEGGQFWATAEDVNGNWVQVREAQTNAVVVLDYQAEAGWEPSENASDYVVIRNTDGLRVPVIVESDGTVWFRMPAGGVTVTGRFIGENQNLSYTALVFVDGNPVPAGTFSGVSFFAKGDNAQQRAEFQDGVTGTPAAPAALVGAPVPAELGEYIALTYDGGAKIVLEHYDIINADSGQIDASLTNEARLNGCFQMPNNDVVIHAYFTAGKVKIAAADIKVVGSGTVGMLALNDAGKLVSVDGVKVGEPFSLSLSPSEGYMFDTAPADGKARIRVFRKDNGGEILPDGAPVVLPTGEVIYNFASMPDCGVKVEVTFDKIAYWVRLSTVDEFGNPLNAAGFWKVTVNKNDTLVENLVTDINLNFGDSVSFALTEAGWSKFSFVKSIINDVTSKNTSFKLTGELARRAEILNEAGQPLPVVIVLKSDALAGHKNPIKLVASFNDAKRGTAGFVITQDSPYNPRAVDPTAFVTEAYAGDTVAIIPQPVLATQYEVGRIRVNLKDGKYIEPEGPIDANGDGKAEEYTFVMPEGGYSSIVINFVPIKYNLTVNTNPTDAAKGLFRVSYTDSTTNSDVLLESSFKEAPFGSKVKITLTEAGKKAGVKIDSITVTPTPTDPKEPKKITNGWQFTMPDADTTVTVNLIGPDGTSATVPTTPVDPDPKPIELPTSTTSTPTVGLQFYDEDNNLEFKPVSGSTVTAKVSPALAAGQTLDGPIQLKDKNGTVVAEFNDGESFEVPYVDDADLPLTASATVKTTQYKVRILVDNAPDSYKLEVDGQEVSAGTTINTLRDYGDTVNITVTGSARKIDSVDGLDSPTIDSSSEPQTASGALKPDASVEDGAVVDVTVKFATNKYSLSSTSGDVDFYDTADCSGSPITEAEENQTVYVKGIPSSTDKYIKTIRVTDDEGTKDLADGGSFTVNSDAEASVTAEEDKTVTIQIVYDGKPDGTVTEVNYDGSAASETITDATDKTVQVKLHQPAGYKFELPASPTKFTITNSSQTTPEFKVDMSQVENGETVTITLGFIAPMRTLPTATSGGTPVEFYDNAACTGTAITTVKDGTAVYAKVNLAAEKYLTSVKIKGTSLSKQSSGAYGPYTVTEDLSNSDFVVSAEYKTVTLVFDYKDGAGSKVKLYDGTNEQTDNSSIKVSSNGATGTAKLSDVKLTVTGTTFGTVKGTNVTATKNGSFDVVTFALDFAKLANGDSVTIEVNVD